MISVKGIFGMSVKACGIKRSHNEKAQQSHQLGQAQVLQPYKSSNKTTVHSTVNPQEDRKARRSKEN